MSNTIKIFLLPLGICLLLSTLLTGFGKNRPDQKIILEELMSVGTIDDDLLFQWAGVATDAAGNIYITDMLDYSLKKIDSSGRLVGSVGRRGKGPGEFFAPRFVKIKEDRLFVMDQFFPGLFEFDTDLHYIGRVFLPVPVSDFEILDGAHLAWVSPGPVHGGTIHIHDLEGKKEKQLVFSMKDKREIAQSVDFTITSIGEIIIAANFRDEIIKLDSDGKEIWRISLLGIKNVEKKRIGKFQIPTRIVYKDITVDSRGRIYVLGGHFSENRSRDIYLLDSDGKITATLTLPETTHMIHIDDRDCLYVRSGEGTALKKYRIRDEDPS